MTDTTNDIIDVRDLIERFEELESEWPSEDNDARNWTDSAEFNELGALLEELQGNGGDEQWRGDWYPVTLIRDSYFNDYMDAMLEECGELPKNLPCYLSITVDYKALQMDYTSIDIDGVTYWYR